MSFHFGLTFMNCSGKVEEVREIELGNHSIPVHALNKFAIRE